jgi:hypothetical protein
MSKKSLNIIISILLMLPLLTGAEEFPQTVGSSVPAFQDLCHTDQCNPKMPKCPLCPSAGSTNLYFYHGLESYLPLFTYSLATVDFDSLSDQGFVRAIFHPPTTLS